MLLIALAVLVLVRVDWRHMNSFHYLILFLLVLCFMLRWSNMRKDARRQELLKKKGAKVSMTRTGDTDVYGPNASDSQELQARVDVAEDNDADAFISIHINSSTNKSVGGFSSYYYPKTNNDARLAQAVQDRLVKNFGLDDLGIRKANFYVNKRCSMPSTLLELAFISNPKEEKLMNSNWYINKLAKSIADGIEDYFK